jgi:hypothetical protein
MLEQFEKLRNVAVDADRLRWSGGDRYLGPINPVGGSEACKKKGFELLDRPTD